MTKIEEMDVDTFRTRYPLYFCDIMRQCSPPDDFLTDSHYRIRIIQEDDKGVFLAVRYEGE